MQQVGGMGRGGEGRDCDCEAGEEGCVVSVRLRRWGGGGGGGGVC